MGARHKLNSASMYGILLISGVAGLGSGSWTVFGLFAVVLTLGAIQSGSIRLSPRPRRRRRR